MLFQGLGREDRTRKGTKDCIHRGPDGEAGSGKPMEAEAGGRSPADCHCYECLPTGGSPE